MSLYERLCGRNELGGADENLQKIAIDQFSSLIIETTYGSISRQQIIDIYTFDAPDQVQLDVILDKPGGASAQREMAARLRGILHLAEGNVIGYGLPSQLEAVIAGI